jgi:hypothetical protein
MFFVSHLSQQQYVLHIGSHLVMCTWAGFAADLLGSYLAHGQLKNNNNNGCIM